MPATENYPNTGDIDFDTGLPIEEGYIPPLVTFWKGGSTKPVFILSPDGRVTIPPGVSMDEVSTVFWEAVRNNLPDWVGERSDFFRRLKFLEDSAIAASKIRNGLMDRIELLEEERRQLLKLAKEFTDAAAELTRRLVITTPCAPQQQAEGAPICIQNEWGRHPW